MAIKVIYDNEMAAEIEPSLLDELLNPYKIKKFLRSDGWATVGIDPIRSRKEPEKYSGPERRGFGNYEDLFSNPRKDISSKEVCVWDKNRHLVSTCNFQTLFESAPGLMLVLNPQLKIAAVSDMYLTATMTKREDIIGRDLFEVFPDNPDDPDASGVKNLGASLMRVLHKKIPDVMPVQKHYIRRPSEEGGGFGERYWSAVNTPVLDKNRKILYIIHRIEDVTEYVKFKLEGIEADLKNGELLSRLVRMESEIFNKTKEIAEVNKRLRQMVEEKELILKEVHHRVKNNMMTISTILKLQSQFTKDQKVKDVLNESGNRIKSMQIIYDKLNYSSDFQVGS